MSRSGTSQIRNSKTRTVAGGSSVGRKTTVPERATDVAILDQTEGRFTTGNVDGDGPRKVG